MVGRDLQGADLEVRAVGEVEVEGLMGEVEGEVEGPVEGHREVVEAMAGPLRHQRCLDFAQGRAKSTLVFHLLAYWRLRASRAILFAETWVAYP